MEENQKTEMQKMEDRILFVMRGLFEQLNDRIDEVEAGVHSNLDKTGITILRRTLEIRAAAKQVLLTQGPLGGQRYDSAMKEVDDLVQASAKQVNASRKAA